MSTLFKGVREREVSDTEGLLKVTGVGFKALDRDEIMSFRLSTTVISNLISAFKYSISFSSCPVFSISPCL